MNAKEVLQAVVARQIAKGSPIIQGIIDMKLPEKLNGFPVCAAQRHANCATVMVIRDHDKAPNHSDLVVATWWPELGNSWQWGHYISDNDPDVAQREAQERFHEVARRNLSR